MQKTKRFLTAALLALALLLALAALAVPVRAADWSGSGSYADPYLIGTAAELEALAASVNASKDGYSGKWFRQTADIEVSDFDPIGNGTRAFAGYYDGDGWSVTIKSVKSGLKYAGLFGKVDGGVVMNVTVNGAIHAENNSYIYVGGIVGYLTDGAGVFNCVNHAAVSGTSIVDSVELQVGGIAGFVGSAKSYLMNCYNDGSAASGAKTGGIVGKANSGSYSYCYSAVVPTEGAEGYVGGFAGYLSKNRPVTGCYAADTWTDEVDADAWLAAAEETSISIGSLTFSGKGFWTIGADGKPAPKTCQHTPAGEGVITPVTCTTDGYTTYTCDICRRTYKDNVIAAPGHDYTETTTPATCTEAGKTVQTCSRGDSTVETSIPALGHDLALTPIKTADGWTHHCARCESDVLIPREARHGAMDLVCVSAEITDPEKYPWTYNAETDELESTNQNQGSTSSRLTLTLRSDKPFTLQFTYGVWSEPGDKLYVYLDDDTVVEGAAGIIQGADRWDETIEPIELAAGEHVFVAEYTKNSLYVSGSDTGYLYGIKAKIVCDHDWVKGETTDPTCTAEGYTTYTCSKCGDVKRDDAVAALDHDDVITGSRATCTADGSITRTCSRCARVLTETEPALGHEKGALLSETDTAWTYRCTRCGESFDVDKAWDGTYTEPKRDADGAYLIGDASELAWLHRFAIYTSKDASAAFSTATIRLTADIYMSGYNWVPPCFAESGGTYYFDSVPYYSAGPFKGTFDGGGHTIHDLQISWNKGATTAFRFDSFGLFAWLSGTVRDLGLDNMSIQLTNQDTNNTYDNWLNVGGIAGFAQSGVTIERCFVNADIDVKMSSSASGTLNPAVGGIVGALSRGVAISDCYTRGDINAAGTGYVMLGGIAGSTRAGDNTITRCWTDAALTVDLRSAASTSYVGGLIGKVDSISTGSIPEVSYCFALNPTLCGSGKDNVQAGRIVGFGARFGSAGSYNYALSSMQLVDVTPTDFDADESGYRNGWGMDLSAADAQLETTYTDVNWNYDEETETETAVWTFSGDAYPRLKWESAETPAGFALTVKNFANAETQLKSGTYAGTVRFTLGGEAGCAVLTSTDGETWTALPGSGSYKLTVESDMFVRIVLRADLNADGSVSSADAVRAKRLAAGLDAMTELERAILGAERVTGLTALRIQRAAAGLYTFGW